MDRKLRLFGHYHGKNRGISTHPSEGSFTKGRASGAIASLAIISLLLPISSSQAVLKSSAHRASTSASAKCTISFLTFQSPALTDKFWKTQVAAVAKILPNVTVKIQYTPGLDRQAFASQLLAAGNLPDVVWETPIPDFVKAGALLAYSAADITKTGAPADAGAIGGKHYSLSVGSQPNSMIFYNKADFASLGLKVPTTYAQFLSVATKLKDAGKTPLLVGGGSDLWTSTMLLGGIVNTDVGPTTPNWMRERRLNKVHFTDANFVAAVTKWQNLVTGGFINSDALSLGYSQLISKFTAGSVSMYPMGAWAASTTASFDIGVFALPTNDGKTIVLGNEPAQRMSVSSKTKCPAQAKAFAVDLATLPSFASAFFTSDGLIPSLKNWKVPAKTSVLQTATYKIFAAKGVKFVSPFGWEGADAAPAGFITEFNKGAQGIMSGGSVSDFLANMDKTFNDLNTTP